MQFWKAKRPQDAKIHHTSQHSSEFDSWRHSLSEMKATVNSAAVDWFSGRSQLKELNETYIALIPKVAAPEFPNQFRPISLCNSSYKILSKMLANRLKQVIPSIISDTQNAFVHGRQIQDNIVVAHEVYHYLRLKRKGSKFEASLKMDMSKAYDRVE
ncbi:unnamed protein product [Prunus armeniaca]